MFKFHIENAHVTLSEDQQQQKQEQQQQQQKQQQHGQQQQQNQQQQQQKQEQNGQQQQQKQEQHGQQQQQQQEQPQYQEPCVNTRSEKKVKKTKDNNREIKTQCHICKQDIFSNFMKMHLLVVHKMLNPYQCQICKQFYPCNSTLRTHVQEVHEKLNAEKGAKTMNELKRQCQICQKMITSSFLKSHIAAVHEKLKPYQCQICHQFYRYKSTLKTHTQVVHEKLKPFKCDPCQESFAYRNVLNDHLRTCQSAINILDNTVNYN